MVGIGKLEVENQIRRLEKALETETHPIVRAILKDKIEALKQQENSSFSLQGGMKA